LVEGRRLVLRPLRRADDTRIEIDLVKLAAAGTRVSVAPSEGAEAALWSEALANLRSVWETGIDLREARAGVLGVGLGSPPSPLGRGEKSTAPAGVRLAAVLADGPAARAGLRVGDVVVAFDGKAIGDEADFVARIRGSRPGTGVTIEVVRDGVRGAYAVTVGVRRGRGEPPPSAQILLSQMRQEVDAATGRLRKAVAGLDNEACYRLEVSGKWSVAMVLAHLSTAERMLQVWMDEAIRGVRVNVDSESCTNPWKLAAALAGEPAAGDLLTRIRRDQEETLALLSHIPEEVSSFRPRWGRLAFLVLDYSTHSDDHLAQIERIRKAVGA
jgi:hypothetical protein